MDESRNAGDRQSVVLEGMYRGVAGKLDEVRRSVSKELQFNSAQQVSAYESLAEGFKKAVDTLLAEFRYLSQQNSAIYDYAQRERAALRDSVLDGLKTQSEQVQTLVTDRVAAVSEKLEESLEKQIAALRESFAEAVEKTIDYDALAEKVAARLAPPAEEPAAEPEPEPAEETAEPAAADDRSSDDGFDYDLLAEKIATILPEADYDLVADKVAATIPVTDPEAIAEKVAALLPQTDEHAIADHVAEAIPLTDYDLVAERVSSVLQHEPGVRLDDESVERIAQRVASLLQKTEIVVAAPAEPPAELAATAALPAEEQTDLTTRYKRSFVAKMIESDGEIKSYYSDLKNELMSYAKVRSQINWSNDRFSIGHDSLAKIGMRGKTLCLYLALDPSEFPESVYHQKSAGDTKMYERTPMMVKIKSGVALKRAIRLVALLMEKNGAVKTACEPVDYAAEYAYRSDEELLAEGLIKTALVEKSDLNF